MKEFLFFTSIGFVIGLVIFGWDLEKTKPKSKNNLDDKTLKYFNEVTLKNELNGEIKDIPHKYKKHIKVYVHGNYESYMMDEVDKVLGDLNEIIDPIQLYLVKSRFESNMTIYFGNYDEFIKNHPGVEPYWKVRKCDGFFINKSNNKTGTIETSIIFINLPNNENIDETKDAIREEITQSLGFYNDTWNYPNSCFYQGGNQILEYSDIDIKLIKHLYND